jgi:SMC interacting uncharacterized protein involved in chromosome segregation
MSHDAIMKELREAVHYAYRLGYVSADRAHDMHSHIDSLVEERDIAKADVEKIVTYNTRLQNELDEARAEVEQLKQALHDARLENSGQAAEIEQLKEKVDQLQYIADFEKAHLFKRQEPSRLEIAAMLKAAWLSNADYKSEERCDEGWWIEQADALIAAAKGGVK